MRTVCIPSDGFRGGPPAVFLICVLFVLPNRGYLHLAIHNKLEVSDVCFCAFPKTLNIF